ncbi:MAG TPA: 2',3'-cyclic-nucleotide 2'-phosphodiesterase, partial [Rhodobacterales bacterium]|nr:2',3'-cyclic-nucleotide 2'-phosphodiesterase [Rhodobacterales bacterium]
LERSAGLFNQITPGKPDQDLLNPGFPAFDFDAILGVRYEINLSRPPMFDKDGHVIHPDAGRIVHLTFDGAPVADDMQFIVATNNYRAGGGGNFPGTGDTIIFEGPDTNRDVVVRYISKHGTITPSTQINWRFAPMPGTTVLFNTGPKAADHIGDVKGVTIEPAGDGPDGFARYRISL